MRFVVAVILACLLCASRDSFAQKAYKCTWPDSTVTYQSHPCSVGGVEKSYGSDGAPSQQGSHGIFMTDHHLRAWAELCQSGSRNVDYVRTCIRGHREAFEAMRKILNTPASSEAQQARVRMCYQRWFKVAIDAVDARMWSYCYYH